MPTETTKSTERCEVHPGSPSVARCARCGRTLCIVCAVPVRGAVLGPECLPPEVAAETREEPARRVPMPRWWAVTGAALTVLVGTTVFPWTRFGLASGWFGAWGLPSRWSLVAAIPGALALGLWVTHRHPGRAVCGIVALLSVAAAAGAELAILNPPPFTKATLAPWVAVASAAVSTAAAVTVALAVTPRSSV
jgi:hypothetical protein